MKKIKLFAVAALTLILASCGGGGVKTQSTEVDGNLKGYFEVVDTIYKFPDASAIKEDKEADDFEVKIRRTDKDLAEDLKFIIGNHHAVDCYIYLYDEKGEELGAEPMKGTFRKLLKLKPGEIGFAKFDIDEGSENTASFKIKINAEKQEEPILLEDGSLASDELILENGNVATEELVLE